MISIHKLTNMVFFALGFMFLPMLAQLSYEWFLPRSAVFAYESVEPAQTEFFAGEPLKIVSTFERKRTADFRYEDILFCDTDPITLFTTPQTIYTSVYKSAKGGAEPTDGEVKAEWVYDGNRPPEPAYCTMRSTIFATLDSGVTKQQTVYSSGFYLLP